MEARWLVVFALVIAGRGGTLSGQGRAATEQVSITLDVNLPAYRVDLVQGGAVTGSWAVAIGSRRFKSPVGQYLNGWLEWNPWWTPPKSDWARRDTVTPPGPLNPMGRVKLAIGNAYFIHGTPADASIGRAASHGCLRMHNEDALDLAQRVLRASGFDSAVVASQAADTLTRRVGLVRPVPVTVRYDVVEWRAGALHVYPDVYRRGAATMSRAMRVLSAGGVDTVRVRRDVVQRAVRRGRSKAALVPFDSLVSPFARASVGRSPTGTVTPSHQGVDRTSTTASC